jgi:hypothetical protein
MNDTNKKSARRPSREEIIDGGFNSEVQRQPVRESSKTMQPFRAPTVSERPGAGVPSK